MGKRGRRRGRRRRRRRSMLRDRESTERVEGMIEVFSHWWFISEPSVSCVLQKRTEKRKREEREEIRFVKCEERKEKRERKRRNLTTNQKILLKIPKIEITRTIIKITMALFSLFFNFFSFLFSLSLFPGLLFLL